MMNSKSPRLSQNRDKQLHRRESRRRYRYDPIRAIRRDRAPRRRQSPPRHHRIIFRLGEIERNDERQEVFRWPPMREQVPVLNRSPQQEQNLEVPAFVLEMSQLFLALHLVKHEHDHLENQNSLHIYTSMRGDNDPDVELEIVRPRESGPLWAIQYEDSQW